MKYFVVLIAILFSACASQPIKTVSRNVLIVGFADGDIRNDEINPLLNEFERSLGKQKSDALKLKITQRVMREAAWTNEVAQSVALSEHYDDIFLVSVSIYSKLYRQDTGGTIGQTGVASSGSIKIAYVNGESGESEILATGNENEDSIYGGDVGVSRTKPTILKSLLKIGRDAVWPIMKDQQKLVSKPKEEKKPTSGSS